jgi:4a-hydroxytetrahydrobiopterin dehydratase
MRTPIEAEQFLATPGLGDWEFEAGAATVTFRTPDFTSGARFALEVAAIADELDHHPDVDLRYGSVTVRTSTHSTGGLTRLDIVLAQRVTELAAGLGFAADPD